MVLTSCDCENQPPEVFRFQHVNPIASAKEGLQSEKVYVCWGPSSSGELVKNTFFTR